jgi:hypothetical protein
MFYLFLDEDLVNSYTRNNEVGIGLGNMIPHLDGWYVDAMIEE